MLKSAVGGVFLAPFLRHRRLEAQDANPKRLIIAFTPDSHPPEWWPEAGADPTSFVLREPLADFEEIRDHLLFVRKVDHTWSFDNHHEAGIAQLFTGERFFDEASHYANGPSVDQVLLDNTDIRGGTPLRSVHLIAADRGGTDKRKVTCYSGPGQPIANQPDPAAAFRDIFDGVNFGAPAEPDPGADLAAAARTRIDRQISEVNLDEVRRIQTFLGSRERTKMEAHVEALYELQTRIDSLGGQGPTEPVGGVCEEVDTSNVSRDDRNAEAIIRWAEVQADVLVNTFTCDRARVAGYHLGMSGGHHNGMWGLQGSQNNNSWHDNVAHISRLNDSIPTDMGNVTTRDAFIRFDRLFSGFIAYLAKKLAAIPEGDGSMLDNTLIYWGVESGTNHSHDPNDMQYLLIGGRNMGFQSGQLLDNGVGSRFRDPAGGGRNASGESAHKLHTSVCHGFGYMTEGFGIEPTCGPYSGVLG